MSLKKINKISSQETFAHVFKCPDFKLKSKGFSLLAKKNSRDNPRLGISLKKKNIKLSVHRNLVKRLIKETFVYQKDKLPNLDYIIISSRGLDIKNPALKHEIYSLWENASSKQVN
mgnify:CR=1 FL=1|tara:strand:- start:4011 stop:4358 length:348 start_codon:yes stop_codon:yes gene_type:complete